MRTRVVFADGHEDVQSWAGTQFLPPAENLRLAVTDAEYIRGQAHAGAWLEFERDGTVTRQAPGAT